VTVVAPLRLEAGAVRGTRIGMRARRVPPGPLLLAGVAGEVVAGLRPGDVVVADRILFDRPGADAADRAFGGPVSVGLPGAAELAVRLRAAGLTVHVGAIVGVDRVVTDPARARYAAAGALAVDMESAVLARTGRLVAVVRALVDTPAHPLVHPGTVARGVAALRALRRAAPVLHSWAAASDPGSREGQAAHADTATLPGEV